MNGLFKQFKCTESDTQCLTGNKKVAGKVAILFLPTIPTWMSVSECQMNMASKPNN